MMEFERVEEIEERQTRKNLNSSPEIKEDKWKIDVVIPVFNEMESIPLVIKDIPGFVREIVVVNNNSTDATEERAARAGATVIQQPVKGYGNACLKGLEYLKEKKLPPDIVVFLDGDYSDHPEELDRVIAPILRGEADMVIGSRKKGRREKGSMLPQQVFGNLLATALIRVFFRYKFSDLGPFRAIAWKKLCELDMQDRNFGWTVEMQVKAAKKKFRCTEVPVTYRKRIGVSKVTGTIKGTFLAGYKILFTIFKHL